MSKTNSPQKSLSQNQKVNVPVLIGSVALLAAAIVGGWNYSISQGRILHVVSGLEQPVTVQLPGMDPMGISRGKIRSIQLPEGDYEATISGAKTETVKFSVRSSFMDRFSKKPLWVLNVGGSALLFSEKINSAGESGDLKFYYGQPFVSWLNVEQPFGKEGNGSNGKSRTGVDVYKESVLQAFGTLARSGIPDEAMDLAEWHLTHNRGDSTMLSQYVTYMRTLDKSERLKKFLLAGMQVRPVEVDWHRVYQDFLMNPKDHGSLIAEYDALLKKEPNDTSLLYLRGRLCLSQRQALEYYNKSLMTSFNNAFTHFAIASSEAGRGEWKNAGSGIRVARSLRPDVLQFQDLLFETRMALGEYDVLESELQSAVEQIQNDITLTIYYCDVLAAVQKHDLAKKVCDTFEKQWSESLNQPPPVYLRSRVLYSIGDFDSMIKLYSQSDDSDARAAYFEALVEVGRMEEALSISPIDDPGIADPFHFLTFATGWKMYGNEERALACEKRAIELLKITRADHALLASLLSDSEAPAVAEVTDIPMIPKLKAIALAYLAQKFPSQKAEYKEMARKLNVDRSYPYHLIAKATAEGKRADKN